MRIILTDTETCDLVRELAALTGESTTEVVRRAVRERLERLSSSPKAGMAERLLAIGRDCAAHLDSVARSADHGQLLYDERGLPRG